MKEKLYISLCGKLHGDKEMYLSNEIEVYMSDFVYTDINDYNKDYEKNMNMYYRNVCHNTNYANYSSGFLTKNDVDNELSKKYNYGVVEEDFISLEDFVKNGKLVGKNFVRTESVSNIYKDFSEEVINKYRDNSVVAIIEYIDKYGLKWYLTYNENNNMYELITPMYTKDKKYKLYGDKVVEFFDKNKIINDIENQLCMIDKRTRK